MRLQVRDLSFRLYASVPQLADGAGSNPVFYGFESLLVHFLSCRKSITNIKEKQDFETNIYTEPYFIRGGSSGVKSSALISRVS